MKFTAWFGIVVGGMMFAQWGFFIAAGQVPELQSEPYRIAFHLAAEALTALGLIVSGVLLLRKVPAGRTLYRVACGLLLYSVVVSPGYFAQQGQWALVAMFLVLLVLAVLSLVTLGRGE